MPLQPVCLIDHNPPDRPPLTRPFLSQHSDDPTDPFSHRQQSARLSDIQTRLHNLRDALIHARQSESFLHDNLNAVRRARISTPPHVMSTSPISESRRRMRSILHRIHENGDSPTGRRSESPGASAVPPSERRRAMPSGSYQRFGEQRMRRVRRFFDQDNGSRESLHELQEVSERLAQSNEDLRNMLDRPAAEPSPSILVEHVDESERRRKRRRTESWRPTELPLPRIEYGHNGQIVSGPLKMEIVSSDAGNLGPSADLQANWSGLGLNGIENILEDSRNVYSAGSRRSNIVLQHQGERPFTLNKLVIKASPGSSTETLLEGLLFVSTRKDPTFDRTTQYQIHHFPTCQFGPRARPTLTHSTSSPNVTDPPHSSSTETITYASNPYAPTSYSRPQTSQPGADCEASSDSSDAERTPRPATRRAHEDVASPTSSDANSDSDGFTASSSSSDSSHHSPPADPGHWTHHRLLRNPFRDLTAPTTGADEDDDYENVLAQFDFDEVLRRGSATSRNRRQRAMYRERADRRRHERDRDANFRRSFLEATGLPAPEQDDDNAQSGTGSDVPGEEARAITEQNELLANLAALTESNAMRLENESTSGAARTSSPLSDFELLPVTASFTAPAITYRRPTGRIKTVQHPAPPVLRKSNDWVPITPHADIKVSATRRSSGRRISIRFDPPIAARYLLLKLWKSGRRGRGGDGYGGSVNGGPDGGVEVQRVRVEGWCGPRFHTATEIA